MPYFAEIENGIVINVIDVDQDVIETFPGLWLETSYNTRGGVHYGPDGQPDGGVALRGNYAGIGYLYDEVLDVFTPPVPEPKPAFTLDQTTFLWVVKPEFVPLDPVFLITELSTLPVGVVGQAVDVDGTLVEPRQTVLFANAGNKDVYMYDGLTGTFLPLGIQYATIIPFGNTAFYYKFDGTNWIQHLF